jgi:hypothetical protein
MQYYLLDFFIGETLKNISTFVFSALLYSAIKLWTIPSQMQYLEFGPIHNSEI